MMSPEVDRFISELRAEPRLSADQVDAVRTALRAADREADDNGDALEFFDAIRWIMRQRSKSVLEKLDAVRKLTSISGKVRILSLRKFLGW